MERKTEVAVSLFLALIILLSGLIVYYSQIKPAAKVASNSIVVAAAGDRTPFRENGGNSYINLSYGPVWFSFPVEVNNMSVSITGAWNSTVPVKEFILPFNDMKNRTYTEEQLNKTQWLTSENLNLSLPGTFKGYSIVFAPGCNSTGVVTITESIIAYLQQQNLS